MSNDHEYTDEQDSIYDYGQIEPVRVSESVPRLPPDEHSATKKARAKRRQEASLFQIEDEISALEDLIEECLERNQEAGEASPEVQQAVLEWFESIQNQESSKLASWTNWLNWTEMIAERAHREAAAFAKKAQKMKARASWIKDELLGYLQRTGQKEVVCANGRTIRRRKNGGIAPLKFDDVETIHIESLDKRFVAIVKEINKVAVRKALEAGEELHFAWLGERGETIIIN